MDEEYTNGCITVRLVYETKTRNVCVCAFKMWLKYHIRLCTVCPSIGIYSMRVYVKDTCAPVPVSNRSFFTLSPILHKSGLDEMSCNWDHGNKSPMKFPKKNNCTNFQLGTKTAPEKLFQTWHVVIPVVSSLWSWCGAPTRTATHRQDWFALCNFDPNSIQQKSATIGLLKKYWKIKLQRFNERFATCFFFDSNFSFVPANVSIWILQEVTKTLLSKWVITYNTFRGEGGSWVRIEWFTSRE